MEENEKNSKDRVRLQDSIIQYGAAVKKLSTIESELKNILKICEIYLAKKQSQTMQSINEAIANGNAVIPSAGEFHLEIGDNSARLKNEDGVDVYDAEGSAYAVTESFFLRLAIAMNTDLQNTFLLDECLSTLSQESSANISKLITESAKTMQFILIEQKPEVFAHGVDKRYMVTKSNMYSEVREVLT
jgi:hypothetical protein